MLCAEEVASMAKESAWVFPLLGMCYKLKDSNPNYKCLIWLKYYCILPSLTSNSPWTWPTTSIESENISTAFPPIFWNMVIPTNGVSYSASLLWPKSLISRISQLWSSWEISGPAPLQILYNSLYYQHILFRTKVLVRKPTQSIFHPCPASPFSLLMGIQQTWPTNQQGLDPWQRYEACT